LATLVNGTLDVGKPDEGQSEVRKKIFDEEKLIVSLIVDEFVDHLIGEQDPKAAGAEPFLITDTDMVKGIVFGIADGGVSQLGGVEAFARVFDPVEDGVFESDTGDLDEKRGIELSTVLDGVVEQFPEGIGEALPDLVRQVGPQLGEQLLQGGDDVEVAGNRELNPVRFGGKDSNLRSGALDEDRPGQGSQVLVFEGLYQQVARLLGEGFDDDLGAFVAGDQNEFDQGGLLSYPRQEGSLPPTGEIQIEQHEVDRALGECFQSAGSSPLMKQGVALTSKGTLDRYM
jgi:hypothetical protein